MPKNIAAGIKYFLCFTTSASKIQIGGLADGSLLPVYAMAAAGLWLGGLRFGGLTNVYTFDIRYSAGFQFLSGAIGRLTPGLSNRDTRSPPLGISGDSNRRRVELLFGSKPKE
jgi:hypothetical protein